LVSRRAWDNLFRRRLHYQLSLAALQASSIVVNGQGKVGSENDAPPVSFQLGQRADFIETLCGEQTTYNRPLVNARDEALCGDRGDLARVHAICFDATLCQIATFLRVGIMQLGLALIEAEVVDHRLMLDDAVGALHVWSHDLTLTARAPLV